MGLRGVENEACARPGGPDGGGSGESEGRSGRGHGGGLEMAT